ncbi:MAG: nucleotidyl transferase AbiEii/AbiGii toxin family protein [Myxococcaceae bacterium]|nr:nucleotidyl transferase AbiEii/AbiGii toxin family protein [Myxococcaceae bacterium]MBH2005952.1 nucleotidyl transferase AbiEii/AbiGii toxin family protein [Myxococcaceae bacterium]
MNTALQNLVQRYSLVSETDYRNALKEIIQEIALLGLWRAKFFEHAAFYGGTALRILYGLDRFSEDLDFSLLKKDPSFSFKRYEKALSTELQSFGLNVSINQKVKTKESAILSAFLKTNTSEHVLQIGLNKPFHHLDSLVVKLEIDTDPPPDFETDSQYVLKPLQFGVRVYSEPCLFAGKLHAVLCRSWKKRVKGRDWYDMLWFIGRGIPVHLKHLEARLRQSGHYQEQECLNADKLLKRLLERIDQTDLIEAKKDLSPFLRNSSVLDIWSPEFFKAAVQQLLFTETL